MMDKEVVYIAELDADVDDVVAAHYLHNKGVLKCVVLDPYPKTKEGIKRSMQRNCLCSLTMIMSTSHGAVSTVCFQSRKSYQRQTVRANLNCQLYERVKNVNETVFWFLTAKNQPYNGLVLNKKGSGITPSSLRK